VTKGCWLDEKTKLSGGVYKENAIGLILMCGRSREETRTLKGWSERLETRVKGR